MQNWHYSGASVVGQSHLTSKTPCQDKFSCKVSEDQKWLSVAVSDGAGSALNAEVGAEITSTIFCEELLGLSKQLVHRVPGDWINDFVVECILKVRQKLRYVAKSDDIKSYHCTLVAALMGPEGGFSIHIGDGSIFGGQFQYSKQSDGIELNSNFIISKPENGEYTNETYFITEGNWIKHLRVMPLPRFDWMVACTDGGAALILEKEIEVKPKFLVPFFQELLKNKFSNKNYISEVLSDPKANGLTTDDKTLFVAIRSSVAVSDNLFFSKDNPVEASLKQHLKELDKVEKKSDVLDATIKKNYQNSIIGYKIWSLIALGILIFVFLILMTLMYFLKNNKVNKQEIKPAQTELDLKLKKSTDELVQDASNEPHKKKADTDLSDKVN
jgi:hypothetical protein